MSRRVRSQSPLELHQKSCHPKRYDCQICRKDHPLRNCVKFKRMNVAEKLKIVKRFKYCENCLAHSHLISRCQNTNRCRQCKGKHHTLLHINERLRPSTRVFAANQSSYNMGMSTLLPTVILKINLGEGWKSVRGMLNPCTEASSLAEFLIERFKIPTERRGSDQWCKISIRPRFDDHPVFNIMVRVAADLPRKQPKEKIDERVSSLYTNLRLADPRFYKNDEINIILGADVYPRLIKSSIQPESVGSPMAQDTILGWVIIGKFGV